MSLRLANKNVKFKPTRKGPQAPSGATAPSLPATPVQPAPAALPEVPTITEAQTGQQKRKEERLPVPSQDVPESAPQPESITPAVRETTPPSESARDSSLGISIAGRDAAPTGLSHATARRSATQTIDIPGSSDEDEGEDASNDQETRRQRDVSPAARAAPASVNNADPAALQLAAAEPPRAIASKGLPHLTTASQSGNAAAPNGPAELQAATRPKSTEPAHILEKIRESMPADLQQLGQASSSVQAAPQSQAQSQSQSQIQSQSQSQPRSHSHFQSQSQSQSQKPQSQSQKAKTLKFVPSRKLGSQRTAAERRQLEIASDDSGFEEETSSQTKKNKKMPKATQKRRAQPLSSQSTKRRRIAADAEEDQATEGIAERREPERSTEAADILVVRNPPSSVPGSLEDATNQQRRSKAVDRSGQKALPPKADRPKKRKKKADQDEDHDATIIIDEETGLARPAKEKIVRKRSKKALNSAAPEAEVDGNAMALVLLPTSEADDRPIDPTQTTMAQICKDPGKGRMSSRFEAMMEAKAAEKQRRKEARERMKRLAKGGHASEGSGDEQTEQMAIGDNVTDQIQDEAVNRETATNEDDNSATQHLAGRKSRSQSQHAIEQLDASGNAAGEGAAQPAEEEHTFTESHLVGRGRLVNGRIVLDEDAMIIDRPIDEDLGEIVDSQPGDRKINSATYGKREAARRWTKDETELFYDAIRKNGSDLTIIACYFPGRTRKQIRSKWHKEERYHPELLDAAMFNREERGDLTEFQELVGLDLSGPCPEDPMIAIREQQKLEAENPTVEKNQVTVAMPAAHRQPLKRAHNVRLPKQYAETNGTGIVSEVLEDGEA